jgi:hypothetical protein
MRRRSRYRPSRWRLVAAFAAGWALEVLAVDAGELWDVRRARETAESARLDADEIAGELRQCRLGIVMAAGIAEAWGSTSSWYQRCCLRSIYAEHRVATAKKEMVWRKN